MNEEDRGQTMHRFVGRVKILVLVMSWVALAALLTAGPARADILNATAGKDNTLYEDAGGALSNGAGRSIFAGRTNNSDLRRAVVAFDLSAIPAGSTINSVTLTLRMTRRPQNDTRNVSAHRALADWGEGTSDAPSEEGEGAPSTTGDATWIHTFYDTSFWSTAGGDYVAGASATTAVANEGDYTWSGAGMVADVQGWVDNPSANFGWVMIGDESENKTTRRFDSRETNEANRRPRLSVDYTPGGGATGACCQGTTCTIDTAANCTTAGGTYQGDGTTCTPNPCTGGGPTTVTITPNDGATGQDNTLYEPDGSETSNGGGDYFFTGLTKNGFRRRGLVKFDIAANVPSGATINDVTLTMHVSRVKTTTSRNTSIHPLLLDWGEGTSNADGQEGQGTTPVAPDATWTNRITPGVPWTDPGAEGDYFVTPSATTAVTNEGFYTWTGSSVISDVQAWLDSPGSNFGWIVIGIEDVTESAKRFDTRENNNAANRPQLEITYTPAQPTGACCTGSTCQLLTESECSTAGGVYNGDGTVCTPNPCAEPFGACCADSAPAPRRRRATARPAAACSRATASTCASAECAVKLTPFVDRAARPARRPPPPALPERPPPTTSRCARSQQQLAHRAAVDHRLGLRRRHGTRYARADHRGAHGAPVTVNWINDLRDSAPATCAPTTTCAECDDLSCIHGAQDDAKTVVHLHGGHVPADVDGYPEDTSCRATPVT